MSRARMFSESINPSTLDARWQECDNLYNKLDPEKQTELKNLYDRAKDLSLFVRNGSKWKVNLLRDALNDLHNKLEVHENNCAFTK